MTLDPSLMAILIAAFAGVLLIAVLVLIWLARKHQKLRQDYEELAEILHGLNNDLRDMHAASLVVNERAIATDLRVHALDGQLNRLAEKIDSFQQTEPSNHAYSQAIQQVRSGASVSELMQSAGLSQDEAALLVRLHGPKMR